MADVWTQGRQRKRLAGHGHLRLGGPKAYVVKISRILKSSREFGPRMTLIQRFSESVRQGLGAAKTDVILLGLSGLPGAASHIAWATGQDTEPRLRDSSMIDK